MFFRKLLSEISLKADSCIDEIRKIGETQGRLSKAVEENSQNSTKNCKEILSEINRHDMAIENMLDEWEEKKEQDRELEKLKDESGRLVDVFSAYHDQLFILRNALGRENPEWNRQLEMMEYILNQKRMKACLQVIEQDNVPVDYSLHEITGIVETHDEKQHGIISEILSPGYIYHGEVIKKALVSVYRMS